MKKHHHQSYLSNQRQESFPCDVIFCCYYMVTVDVILRVRHFHISWYLYNENLKNNIGKEPPPPSPKALDNVFHPHGTTCSCDHD